jgi:hypothetical protein
LYGETGIAELGASTGSAILLPVTLRLYSRNVSASDWDIVNSWANLDFYSDDVSGPGAGVRARIGAGFETVFGSTTYLAFSTSTSALSEAMRITSAGRVLVGHTASVSIGGINPAFAFFGDATLGSAITHSYWAADATGASLQIAKSRSATKGSFTTVAVSDIIGRIRFIGDDGTDLATLGAEIRATAEGTITTSRVPMRLGFFTASGAADDDATERMRVTSAGVLVVGATAVAPGGNTQLEVSRATGTATITPATLTIRSTSSAADWDITNSWANLDFWSNDGSGLGSAVRARVGAGFENAAGSLTYLAFSTSTGSALTERVRIASSGAVTIGGTLTTTGNITINRDGLASAATLLISADAGQIKQIAFYSANVTRWALRVNATAESGGDAGTNLELISFTDAGATIDTPISILRVAGGAITFRRPLTFVADNTYDIGASGATRPRRVYVGTGLQIGARPDYTVTNPTTNRSLDVTGATIGQVAQVVGTIIQDFIDREIFQ